MSPDSPWFYILVTTGATLVSVIARWVWVALRDKFREWVREPVIQAKENAEAAAVHAETVQEAIGVKNGNADLMTMVSRMLANQNTQFEWQRDHQAQNDAMAATLRDTRASVLDLTRNVADLQGRVTALELTRPPLEEPV